MKINELFKKDMLLTMFVWITIMSILQNPSFPALNILIVNSQTTQNLVNPLNGLTIQGSSIVSYSTNVIQIQGNDSSVEPINIYQVSVIILNLMSILISVAPFIVFVYWRKKTERKQNTYG